MAAVANITEFSNSVTIGNALSRLASPALVKSAVGLNSLYREDLPSQTNVKKFVKRGYLTAATLAESTALAPDANGELTDSSISATAAKIAVVSGLSVEAQQFGNIDLRRVADEQGAAMGRAISDDIIGMASGLATTQTSTSVMTIDDLMLAVYSIHNSKVPNQDVLPHAILGPKAVYNLKKEIIQNGASAFVNPNMLAVLGGLPSDSGFIGDIPGVCKVFQTTGFATTGGDDQQLLIHPMWCLAGIFGAAPVTWFKDKGAEGFYSEVASYYFYDVIEWNDLAGVQLRSDT